MGGRFRISGRPCQGGNTGSNAAGATNEINRTSPFTIHALFLPCDQILTAFPDFPPLTMSRYTIYCTSTQSYLPCL